MTKVLMISTDRMVERAGCKSRHRLLSYGKLFDELVIAVMGGAGREEGGQGKKKNVKIKSWPGFRGAALIRMTRWARRLMENNPEEWVVSTQDSFEQGLAGWWLKRTVGVAWQVQVHTDWLSPYFRKESWKNWLRVLIARLIIGQADGVRVVSDRIKRGLVDSGLVRPERIAVLPILVDSLKTGKNKEQTAAGRDFVILMVSRLTKEKNIGLALKALAVLRREHKEAKLVIVGDGPERRKLEAEAKRLKAREAVSLVGWQDDWEDYLSRADVYLMTSNYEGYGRTVAQALAAGVPVVMTEVGVAGELVRDGENGRVVSVGSQKEVVAALKELIENEERRRRWGERGKETAKKIISSEAYLEDYKNLIEKCRF